MKETIETCPTCEAPLQAARLDDTTHYVCKCGYSKPIPAPKKRAGQIQYRESVGFRQLTIHDERPTGA